MATNQLTITFQGICCHFHGIVPAVPHRVVLPDASAVRFGMLRMPPSAGSGVAPYYLMPHLAIIGQPIDGGFGMHLTGAQVQVVNAVSPDFIWTESPKFAIAQYVPRFAFSEEVVFGGRAACYFDVFQGVGFTVGTGDQPRSTVVQMETDGPPQIRITPFPGSALDLVPMEVTLNSVDNSSDLVVSNLDVDASLEDAPFDFLLNYLVARGGIPTVLSELTPGLPENPPMLTMGVVGDRLQSLGEMVSGMDQSTGEKLQALGDLAVNGGRPSNEVLRRLLTMVVDNQSCSDSHYP